MDRKGFLQTALGTFAAVTFGDTLESLLPVPKPLDVPGIGGTVFKAKFIRGTFTPYELIQMSGYKNQIYLQRKDDDTITGIDVITGEPVLEIDERENYNFLVMDVSDDKSNDEYWSNGRAHIKICSAYPEHSDNNRT